MTQRFSLYEDLTVEREPALLRRHLRRAARRSAARASTEVIERAGLGGPPRPAGRHAVGRLEAAGRAGQRHHPRAAAAVPRRADRRRRSGQPPRLLGPDPPARRAEGTTVLLTTHYMDEAERCHRLAFIFRGSVLDIGTPERDRRRAARPARRRAGGRRDRARPPTRAARPRPRSTRSRTSATSLRVATRDGADPARRASRAVLRRARHRASSALREARVTVEDAFVSMVRADERAQAGRGLMMTVRLLVDRLEGAAAAAPRSPDARDDGRAADHAAAAVRLRHQHRRAPHPDVVYDQDRSAESRDLARSLEATGFYDLVGDVARLRRDRARAALRRARASRWWCPPRFGADLRARAARRACSSSSTAPIRRPSPAPPTPPRRWSPRARPSCCSRACARRRAASPRRSSSSRTPGTTPTCAPRVYIVPGLVGVILTMTMVMLTAMAIARERERGTLEQLIVSPVRRLELWSARSCRTSPSATCR